MAEARIATTILTEHTLTMSQLEAEALRALLGRVSGMPESSDRGLIDAIRNAMDRAGIANPYGHGGPKADWIDGSIGFKDRS